MRREAGIAFSAAFIACEYNPFTLGHALHIAETRRALKPDAIACIMGGSFMQRGSPAIADKWARARMALEAGADLVFELHPAYACASAERFAEGAVLTALAVMGDAPVRAWLSFGAEDSDLSLLLRIAGVLAEETEGFRADLAQGLSLGLSYASARARAADLALQARDASMAMRMPNNILAIEYIKAILRTDAPIAPFAVARAGSPYHDSTLPGIAGHEMGIASATAIRESIRAEWSGRHAEWSAGLPACGCEAKAVRQAPPADMSADALDVSAAGTPGGTGMPGGVAAGTPGGGAPQSADWRLAMPPHAAARLAEAFADGSGPVFDDSLFVATQAALLRLGKNGVALLPDVSEGLENRICRIAGQATDGIDSLVSAIRTKRYPATRIRRILTYALLGVTRGSIERMRLGAGPPYLHVLGANAAGRALLAVRRGAPAAAREGFARLRRAGAAAPAGCSATNQRAASEAGPYASCNRAAAPAGCDNNLYSRERIGLFMALEALATDMRALGAPNPARRAAGRDFTEGPQPPARN